MKTLHRQSTPSLLKSQTSHKKWRIACTLKALSHAKWGIQRLNPLSKCVMTCLIIRQFKNLTLIYLHLQPRQSLTFGWRQRTNNTKLTTITENERVRWKLFKINVHGPDYICLRKKFTYLLPLCVLHAKKKKKKSVW